MRRFILITIIVLLALGLVGVLVYVFNGPITAPAPQETTVPERDFTPLPLDPTQETTMPDTEETAASDIVHVGTILTAWDEPVAGAIFKDNNTVRIVERATGHIYDIDLTTGEERFASNLTIPKIHEVIWDTPSRVILRYLQETGDAIESFAATIADTPTTTNNLSGFFLPQNIRSVAARGGTIAYTLGSSVVTDRFEQSNPKTVATLPGMEWTITWLDDKTLGLLTAPSRTVPGYLFALPATGGSLTPIIRDALGLTVLPHEDDILYRASDHAGVFTRSSADFFEFSPLLIPELCVWSAVETGLLFCATTAAVPTNYPDDWYQGHAEETTALYRFNIFGDRFASFELPPLSARTIAISPDETRVLLIDRASDSLWIVPFE